MKTILTTKAKNNLKEVYNYISRDNKTSAQKVLNKIYGVIYLLEKNPYIGVVGRIENTRDFCISDINYFVVYKIQNDILEIVAILHTSRKY